MIWFEKFNNFYKVYVPSQCHPWIGALILRDTDMTDLELRARTPYESLYRISGSLRPDSLAGIDAWGWYVLPAHLRSLFAALIFLTPMLFDKRPDFVFIYFPRVKRRVKNVTLENRFYDYFSRFSVQNVHFSGWLFFHRYFGTFTVLSLCPRCDLWPVSHASPWTQGRRPTFRKLILFTAYSGGESVATIRVLSVLYLRPLTALAVADFHQSNWFRVFCDRLLRIVKSMMILINIKKYFTREEEIVCVISINSMILMKISYTNFFAFSRFSDNMIALSRLSVYFHYENWFLNCTPYDRFLLNK